QSGLRSPRRPLRLANDPDNGDLPPEGLKRESHLAILRHHEDQSAGWKKEGAVGTVIPDTQHGNKDRHQRWERLARVDLFAPSGVSLGGSLVKRSGLGTGVGASSVVQHQVNGQVEEAIVASRREESARWAPAMPAHAIPVAKDATGPGGLGLGALDPKRHSILWEQAAPAREQDTGQKLMAQAL